LHCKRRYTREKAAAVQGLNALAAVVAAILSNHNSGVTFYLHLLLFGEI
jgi:hypothetical protein